MASKNSIKPYIENGYYHLYNRGVNKRLIFRDKKDCIVFQRYLKQYLSPIEELKKLENHADRLNRLVKANMHGEIELLAFALMPNHIHLLVKQLEPDGIVKFMRKLCVSYSMYFNRKYKRVGHLFQDRYKGVIVLDDNYLLHLSRYIHLNPTKIQINEINFNEFTSYPYYLGLKEAKWLETDFIHSYFMKNKIGNYKGSYKKFVEDYKADTTVAEQMLIGLTLED
ncbi:MAG TPA: transposase [Patescibacteria group bacterium]|nr:transposase [Patescibacteria group bacterium]